MQHIFDAFYTLAIHTIYLKHAYLCSLQQKHYAELEIKFPLWKYRKEIPEALQIEKA